jgi:hypothetical protein
LPTRTSEAFFTITVPALLLSTFRSLRDALSLARRKQTQSKVAVVVELDNRIYALQQALERVQVKSLALEEKVLLVESHWKVQNLLHSVSSSLY